MHEISLIQSTLDVALAAAEREGAERIHLIKMRIGKLSGVVPEALEFAFGALIAGTKAEGAALEVEYVPISCFCAHCNTLFEPPDLLCECPCCHHLSRDLRSGKEIELTSMEVS